MQKHLCTVLLRLLHYDAEVTTIFLARKAGNTYPRSSQQSICWPVGLPAHSVVHAVGRSLRIGPFRIWPCLLFPPLPDHLLCLEFWPSAIHAELNPSPWASQTPSPLGPGHSLPKITLPGFRFRWLPIPQHTAFPLALPRLTDALIHILSSLWLLLSYHWSSITASLLASLSTRP